MAVVAAALEEEKVRDFFAVATKGNRSFTTTLFGVLAPAPLPPPPNLCKSDVASARATTGRQRAATAGVATRVEELLCSSDRVGRCISLEKALGAFVPPPPAGVAPTASFEGGAGAGSESPRLQFALLSPF